MKKLSKVILDVKNIGIHKGHNRVCGDLLTDLSTKNCWFPKHKYYLSATGRRELNGSEVNINLPKAPNGRPVNEENLLSPGKIFFKFLNKSVKYAQCHFENKLWNKMKPWNT